MLRSICFVFMLLASIFFTSCKNNQAGEAISADFEKQMQEKLVNAKEGDVIELPEGTFNLSRPLILDGIGNITIRGKGMEKTILNFKGQKDGAEGLRITANGIVLEDFAIKDAKGDCIKIQDATNVTIRRVKSGWTAVHSTSNGSYGLYPVASTNVLIEDCEVYGSSDAGIYVGQSKNIIVRRNKVHDNVAGIEIENCTDSEVYENSSYNNTGGILVFDLPDLSIKNGMRCRVHNNKLYDNNTGNFGPKGTAVSEIPAGTGLIVMATNQCEIYANDITNHNSVSAAVVSYLIMRKPFKDSIYDPYCGGISIHDNKITRGTGSVDKSVALGKLMSAVFGDKIPDVIFDGSINPAYRNTNGSVKEEQRICIKNNGDIHFANMDWEHNAKNISTDLSAFDCAIAGWNEVKINQ
ncbi:MAG: parallel beta-helix domain-containing protein [Chitinophagales bacterium]